MVTRNGNTWAWHYDICKSCGACFILNQWSPIKVVQYTNNTTVLTRKQGHKVVMWIQVAWKYRILQVGCDWMHRHFWFWLVTKVFSFWSRPIFSISCHQILVGWGRDYQVCTTVTDGIESATSSTASVIFPYLSKLWILAENSLAYCWSLWHWHDQSNTTVTKLAAHITVFSMASD